MFLRFGLVWMSRAAPFTLPLGGSETSLRVFGEGLAALRKTLPGRSLLTADPPRGRVKEIAQLQKA